MTNELAAAKSTMTSLLPSHLTIPKLSPPLPKYPVLNESLDFQAELVADLVHSRRLSNALLWQRCVGDFMPTWFSLDAAAATAYAESVREHFHAIDKAKYAPEQNNDDEEGEVLCSTLFSLAYGTLLLLSHTTLRLIRGRRYGILGPNGSGKTTLMRQLKDGKVENFPPQSELRCVMVEHSLQGENTALSIVDFIASGMGFPELIKELWLKYFDHRPSTCECSSRKNRRKAHRGWFR